MRHPNYDKLHRDYVETRHDHKMRAIMDPAIKPDPLSPEEREKVRKLTTKRRLLLQIYTTTDVAWHTISTADAGLTLDEDRRARLKMRNLWYDGFSAMYPEGTQWRLKHDYY